jgi:hypothetical protein
MASRIRKEAAEPSIERRPIAIRGDEGRSEDG